MNPRLIATHPPFPELESRAIVYEQRCQQAATHILRQPAHSHAVILALRLQVGTFLMRVGQHLQSAQAAKQVAATEPFDPTGTGELSTTA